MIRLQVIDDEPAILKAIQRLLRQEGWQVDTASCPLDCEAQEVSAPPAWTVFFPGYASGAELPRAF